MLKDPLRSPIPSLFPGDSCAYTEREYSGYPS